MRCRLREYELRGAESNLQIQRAARAVALENQHLRRLLARHGVSAAEVERFLQACGNDGDGDDSSPPSKAPAALSSEIMHSSSAANTQRNQEAGTCASLSSRDGNTGGRLPAPPLTSEPGRHASTAVPISSIQALTSKTTTLETHCDDAAGIIAQLRGDGDSARARALLGCSGSTDCVVRNTVLFQLMDQDA